MHSQRVILDPLVGHKVALGFFIILAPFEYILPKQKVEHKAHDRDQGQEQNPGHRRRRVPVLHKNRQTDRNHRQRRKNTDDRPPGAAENAKAEIIKSKQSSNNDDRLNSSSH
ncbi:hypothetical protein D3C73_1202290 [compost metagenome]